MTVEAPVRETAIQGSTSRIDGIFRTYDVGNMGRRLGTLKDDGSEVTFRDIIDAFKEGAIRVGRPALASGSERQIMTRLMQLSQVPGGAAAHALESYDQQFPQQPQVK